jgi:hypothetical protein
MPNIPGFTMIFSIFSEIIQGDVCENITKRRKLDDEHEKMTINVDTVGKRSISYVMTRTSYILIR